MNLSPRSVWFLKYLGVFFTIPIIGTLAHELGHYLVADYYRVPAMIAYAFTYYFGYLTPEQEFWFIVGGPVSTWLVAAIGIGITLWKYRPMHSEQTRPIGLGQSAAAIASTFSLRFVFNAGMYFFSHTLLLNPSGADEVKIAQYLGISPDLMMYGSALVGLLVVLTALYYIPRSQRYIILLSGFLGGVLGYLFWYSWVGPLVLPIP
jgi:hypothetical protein